MRKLCAFILVCSLLFGQTVLAEESEISGADSMDWWVNWGGTGLGLEFSRVCINGEYTVCALEENGELWRLYPQVEMIAQDVKKAQGFYYLKKNGELFQCGDDTQPLLSKVNDFSFKMSEGDSCYIHKTDHTLWSGSQDGEFTQIDNSVIQMTDWGYLKEGGTLIDYNGEQYSRNVEYLTENGRGYYVENDGFYRYNGGEESDYKLFDLRAIEYAEYWTNAEFAVYNMALTDTGEVWAFPSSEKYHEPMLLGENAVELGWNGGKVDWRDAEGNMYCIDQKIVPSSEPAKIISIRHLWDNNSYKDYDVYYEDGIHGYLVRGDAGKEKLLQNVCYVVIKQDQTWIRREGDLDLVTEGRGLAIQTDGSVWDVTEAPEKLGVLPVVSSIKGDVTEDGTVNVEDLRMLLRAICGKVSLTEQQKSAADVESDNDVNIADLRKILRYTCGKIERL